MTDMFLKKSELKQLLRKLQKTQTESPSIDAKEELSLTSRGDKARFIRHIVALANTGQPSYLLLGIKDKTWNVVGIPESSPLLEMDMTQQRMNQVLMSKVDPSLAIRYTTYELSSGVVGVVAVHGKVTPYVIAIEDAQYGGTKNRGASEYIQRGAIYIRQGANSIVANRRSQIVPLVNTNPPSFLLGSIYVVGIGILLNALLGFGFTVFGHDITPAMGAIIGTLLGFMIGFLFTKNLSETMGALLKEVPVKKFTQAIWGVLFCVLDGAYVGYKFVDALHTGKPLPSSPLITVIVFGILGGSILGPLAAGYTTFILNAFGIVADFFMEKLRHLARRHHAARARSEDRPKLP